LLRRSAFASNFFATSVFYFRELDAAVPFPSLIIHTMPHPRPVHGLLPRVTAVEPQLPDESAVREVALRGGTAEVHYRDLREVVGERVVLVGYAAVEPE